MQVCFVLALQPISVWSILRRRRKWNTGWVLVCLCGVVQVLGESGGFFRDRYQSGGEKGTGYSHVDMSHLQLTKLPVFGSDDLISGGFQRSPNNGNLAMENYKPKPLWKTSSTAGRTPSRLANLDPEKVKALTEGSQIAAQLLSGNPSASAQVAAGVVREIGDFVGEKASSAYYDVDGNDNVYVNRLGLSCDPNTSRFLCFAETTTTTTTTPPGIFQRRRGERLRAEEEERKKKDEQFYADLRYNPFKHPPKGNLWEEKQEQGYDIRPTSSSLSQALNDTDSGSLSPSSFLADLVSSTDTAGAAASSEAESDLPPNLTPSGETPSRSISTRNSSFPVVSNSSTPTLFSASLSGTTAIPAILPEPAQPVFRNGGRRREYSSALMLRDQSPFPYFGQPSFPVSDQPPSAEAFSTGSPLPRSRGFSTLTSSEGSIKTFAPVEMNQSAPPPTLPSVESVRRAEKKYRQKQRQAIRLERMYAQPQVTHGSEIRKAATDSNYEMRTPSSPESVLAAREQLSKRKKEYREELQTLREAEEQLEDLQKLIG